MVRLLAGLVVTTLATAAIASEAPHIASAAPQIVKHKLQSHSPGRATVDLSKQVDQFVAQGDEIATLKLQIEAQKEALRAISEKVDGTLGGPK